MNLYEHFIDKYDNSNLLKINTHGSGGMMLSPFTNVTILLEGTLLCWKQGLL